MGSLGGTLDHITLELCNVLVAIECGPRQSSLLNSVCNIMIVVDQVEGFHVGVLHRIAVRR